MRTLYSLLILCCLLIPAGSQAQDSPLTLVLWHHYADDRADVLADLAATYSAENPAGVVVTVQYYPDYSRQHDAILSALLNNTTNGAPNLAFVRNFDAALYQLSDALVDLSPYVAASAQGGDLNPDDFHPLIWEQDVYAGERLGLPLVRGYEAMYINMDALRELGYDSAPRTRAELGDMACAYTERYRPDRIGFEVRLDASFLLALAYPGQLELGEAAEVSGLTDAFAFLREMFQRGCMGLNINQLPSPQNRFASGGALFYFEASGALPYVETAIGTYFAQPFDLGVYPVPGEAAPALNLYGASLSIFEHDPATDAAAWEFAVWLAQPAQMNRWAAANHALPARLNPEMWGALAGLEGYTEPNRLGYDLIRDELIFALRGVLAGEDLTARLESLEQVLSAIMQAFGE